VLIKFSKKTQSKKWTKCKNILSIYDNKTLWLLLYNHYGRNIAEYIMPPIYIFPLDYKIFKQRYKKKSYYILKSEKQKKMTLRLTNNKDEILLYKTNKYLYVQEHIKNPLLFNNYKITFTLYVAINNNAYLYNDGIITYALHKYDKHNLTYDNAIVSKYKQDELYDIKYPLLLSEYLNIVDLPWNSMKDSIKQKLVLIMNVIKHKLPNNDFIQLFSMNVCFTNELEPFILNFKNYTKFTYYEHRDHMMKKQMLNDSALLINNKIYNFEKIIM